jgi:hypothetical protein
MYTQFYCTTTTTNKGDNLLQNKHTCKTELEKTKTKTKQKTTTRTKTKTTNQRKNSQNTLYANF